MKINKLSLTTLLVFVLLEASLFAQGYITVTDNSRINMSSETQLIIPGDLTINSGSIVSLSGNLTISGDLLNNAGSSGFVITSDATCTGSLIVNGAGGDASTQRYLAAATWDDWEDGWHFVSSPVADYPIQGNFTVATAADYDFYAWSEVNNLWINFKNTGTSPTFLEVNGSNTFELGHGYMVAYKTTSTKEITGAINVSDVSISGLTITGSKDTYYSWHLLGNPFPSALTWDASVDWGKTNIAGTAKIWNEANKSYTTLSAGDPIPATNGFMVQASGGTGSLTIPKSKRVHNAQAFYKNADYPLIKLKANNIDNPSAQESEIRFNPASTTNYDLEFDSDFLPGYAPSFFSYIVDRQMAVNSMPIVDKTTTVPFTFIKNEGLNFSIEMYEEEGMLMDVWLLDHKNGNRQNLSENSTYLFTAFEADKAERFEIQFSAVGIDEENNLEPDLQIWASAKTIHILNPDLLEGTIKVFNMLGQNLNQYKLSGGGKEQFTCNLPVGNYIVQIVCPTQIVSKKVFIN